MRPRYSALNSERGSPLAPLDNAVERYLADVQLEPSANAVNEDVFARTLVSSSSRNKRYE
jgi:hypothetical protein